MATSSIAPRACLDAPALNGSVALREDAPLKRVSRSGGGVALGGCARGPRLIPLGFGALSACITVALLAQVYSGDYELVPHGVLSSSAAACSRAATDALKEGGRAIDAAAVAALCLAALAPHRTSLDASGALLHWEYREVRTQQPTLYEWGGPPRPQDPPEQAERPPRLVAALAYLHAQLGALPWARVLQPAIQLASKGFPVSEGLAMSATRARPVQPAGANSTAPELARYLASLRANTSAELNTCNIQQEHLPRELPNLLRVSVHLQYHRTSVHAFTLRSLSSRQTATLQKSGVLFASLPPLVIKKNVTVFFSFLFHHHHHRSLHTSHCWAQVSSTMGGNLTYYTMLIRHADIGFYFEFFFSCTDVMCILYPIVVFYDIHVQDREW